MKAITKLIMIILPATLTACVQSSGILKVGLDTYTVSAHAAPAAGGESGARRKVLTQANKYCENEGKEIVVTNRSSRPSSYFAGDTVEITFMCLEKGDKELVRPKYEAAPDVKVEVK